MTHTTVPAIPWHDADFGKVGQVAADTFHIPVIDRESQSSRGVIVITMMANGNGLGIAKWHPYRTRPTPPISGGVKPIHPPKAV